jgi:aminoglycoside phosphotransferase (APT) family kinase protein
MIVPGVATIHSIHGGCKVQRHPGDIVVKSARGLHLGEAEALRVAAEAGLPVPRVHETGTPVDGVNYIKMDFIAGRTLENLWKEMSTQQKQDITRQLRDILTAM